MCGIAGIIGRDIPSRKDKLESMLASIRHRGPDEGGTMCDEAVCMGMNRLSIIDT